jgi:hypothetical protein
MNGIAKDAKTPVEGLHDYCTTSCWGLPLGTFLLVFQ